MTQPPQRLQQPDARSDIVLRLRRAEGQLRGIQRMVAQGDDCQRIAQQFSAVRSALDATYLRMTMCVAEQGMSTLLARSGAPAEGPQALLSDLERMLARIR